MNLGKVNLGPLAEPYFIKGSDTGILFIHGFTGTPAKLRMFADDLQVEGFTMSGILLSGHNTSLKEMEQTKRNSWIEDARKGFAELQKNCDRVFVMGFSMGGVLALRIASELPVDRVITLNAPFFVRNSTLYFSRILYPFMRYVGWPDDGQGDNTDNQTYNLGYEGLPVKAGAELVALMKETKAHLKNIVCPALIIQSDKDDVVDPYSARFVYQNISSVNKEVFWLKKSAHVSQVGPEKDILKAKVHRFITSAV